MMYKAFFDTNILAYEFDERKFEKRSVAVELLNEWRPSGRMIISTQVLQELYVVLTQKLKPSLKEDEAEEVIQNYSRLDIVILEPSLIFEGVRIKRRYAVKHYLPVPDFLNPTFGVL